MKELNRFRQFLAEEQINENIEQIFKDTYEGYAEGFQGDPDEVDEFTWEAEEMTDPENYEDDRIAQFKAMQDYLKKNKQYTDTIYGAKVTFTLEPNGEDIKMVSDPSSQMEELNESAMALFTILANTLAVLAATGKGKDLLNIPIEMYEKFRGNRKLKAIINRLSNDPEVMAAVKNPNKGWKQLISSKLTDEEKGYIEGTVWTGSDFKSITRKDFD